MRLEARDVFESADGKWASILRDLGIEDKYLKNKHGPCPMCGGKDRYRFDDKGKGLWFCSHCGSGGGTKLLMLVHGWSFPQALERVNALAGTADVTPLRLEKDPAVAIRKLLSGAVVDQGRVQAYLNSRGLSCFPRDVKYHPAVDYYTSDMTNLGPKPCMLAAMRNRKGKLVSVHRTYLADVKTRKKVMPPIESLKGSAIRLFEHGEILGIAEGIETAIACHELFNMPVWAAYAADNLKQWEPPSEVKKVTVFGDNDASYTGQAAAFELAKRLTAKGIEVGVYIPPKLGDWLDHKVENDERHRSA